MEEKFLQILREAYGSDIAYHETESTIKVLLKAMQKAYELGKSKVNNGALGDVINCPNCKGSYVVKDLDDKFLCKDCGSKFFNRVDL